MKTSTKLIIGEAILVAALAAGLAFALTRPARVETLERTNTVREISNVWHTRTVVRPYPVSANGAVDEQAIRQVYTDYSNFETLPIMLIRSNDYIVARHYESEDLFYDPAVVMTQAAAKNELAVYYTIKRAVNVVYSREIIAIRGVSLGAGVLVRWDTLSNRLDAGAGITARW